MWIIALAVALVAAVIAFWVWLLKTACRAVFQTVAFVVNEVRYVRRLRAAR